MFFYGNTVFNVKTAVHVVTVYQQFVCNNQGVC